MRIKKAFAYLRVSSKGQVRGHGYKRQATIIENYAITKGYKIIRTFKEPVSGSKDNEGRPEFERMIAAVLQDGVSTILIASMDRLSRDQGIQNSLLSYLASKEIWLISADTGMNVTKAFRDDPMGRAMVQMQGVFAELEKNRLITKLRLARKYIRRKEGKCEGRKSYAEVAPELVKEIRRLRRKPRGRDRKRTYSQIATILNERGERTLTGREFSNKTIFDILKKALGKVA